MAKSLSRISPKKLRSTQTYSRTSSSDSILQRARTASMSWVSSYWDQSMSATSARQSTQLRNKFGSKTSQRFAKQAASTTHRNISSTTSSRRLSAKSLTERLQNKSRDYAY